MTGAPGAFVSRADLGGVAVLRLNRPPLNVLTTAMMVELAGLIEGASRDRSVKAVQVRGEGRAFSAGVDMADHTPERAPAMMDAFLDLLHALDQCEVPVVAAVHGHCLGGGLELAACCDLVYAAEGAKLGQPEVKVGVFPPGAVACFPSRIGLRATAEVVLLGETFSAARGKEMGLVNGVFADAELFARTDEVCAKFAELSRPVLSLTKRALRRAAPALTPRALEELRELYLGDLMAIDDAHEGLRAFAERRRPAFKDH
jgi:cyclohexa-1,5-dienecarbonyl-CoA hydratase